MTQKGSVLIPAAAAAALGVVCCIDCCIVPRIVRCIGRGKSGRADATFGGALGSKGSMGAEVGADATFGGALTAWLCFS